VATCKHDRDRIEQALARKLPRPTKAEGEQVKRDAAKCALTRLHRESDGFSRTATSASTRWALTPPLISQDFGTSRP
jgi:hypothetical protein